MPTSNSTSRWGALVGLVVLTAAACASGDDVPPPGAGSPSPVPTGGDVSPSPTPTADATSPSPDPTDTPGDGARLGASCRNPQVGYEVGYPEDWLVNDGGVLPTCSLFDPETVDVEPGTEIPRTIAVALRGSDLPFDRLATAPGDEPGTEVLARTDTTVGGRDAVAVRFEATEDAPLLEPGTRGYRYVVDLGDAEEIAAPSTLIAVTYDVGAPRFARKQQVLDAMMDSLALTPPATPSPETALGDDQAVALGFSETLTGVAVIGATDGEVLRELPGGLGEGASSLDYVPGRNAVLYSRVVTAARSEIVEVPLDGAAPPHVLDVGYAVDATDDGRRIAVARHRLRDGGPDLVELQVRTAGDEVLGTWTAESTAPLPAEPANLAWSDDGTRLAFDVVFEDGVSAFLLDVEAAPETGALFDVARPLEPGEERGAMTSRPFWLPDGSLGVIRGCCGIPGFDTWSAVLVDPATERVTETLFEVDRGVGPVDVHSEQRRLLLVLTHEAFGDRGEPQPDQLVRWQSGPPAPVGRMLQDAAW